MTPWVLSQLSFVYCLAQKLNLKFSKEKIVIFFLSPFSASNCSEGTARCELTASGLHRRNTDEHHWQVPGALGGQKVNDDSVIQDLKWHKSADSLK